LIGAAAASVAITSVAPNPVKEAMDIRYTLPENGFVEIALLDARGTIVQSLFQAVQSAGEHTLNAKIGWLASGSYTLQIRALGQMQTRLVQIVR
ncbi:MAG: T9SS type A sorting domain-containing protein, partial [Candidatus Kapaibacteriota bacterium]